MEPLAEFFIPLYTLLSGHALCIYGFMVLLLVILKPPPPPLTDLLRSQPIVMAYVECPTDASVSNSAYQNL